MAFEMPNNLPELSVEDITGKITEAREEFNELNASDDVSDETLERMEELANAIEDLQAEKSRRVEAASRREELAARVAEAPAAEEAAEAVEEEAEVVEAAAEEAEVVEAEAEVTEAATEEEEAVELSSEEAEEVVIESTPETPKESAIVAASPNTSIPENNTPQVLIAAAQDVPQFYVGQRLDPVLLADAIHNKARMLSDSRGAQTVYPVATIERPFGEGYDLEGLDQATSWDRIADMTKPNALVAAGGWCAPSETVYELFDVECESDNLFQLPQFRVTRGGVRWPVFEPFDPNFNPGFIWTEADDIAATAGTPTKPCVRIPCPTFAECRLDAVGLCITAGNLIDRAYPEQVRWFINRAIRAYERQNSIRKLVQILSDATPVALPGYAAAAGIVSSLLLEAASYRQQNGLCCGERLDVILPCWALDLVKADIVKQEGALTIGSLPTDADVRAWFASANLTVQFVNNWQNFPAYPATTWPANLNILLGYPGSYVEFNQGRLDLGVIRDSVLNATNDYTAVWFEEFYCVGRRGPSWYNINLPICPNGAVGDRLAGPCV